MFTFSEVKRQSHYYKRAHYSCNGGTLYVYYSNEEKNASLNVLLNPKSEKFSSMTFTSHYPSISNSTTLFSIMNVDDDTISLNVSNNSSKFLAFDIPKKNQIIAAYGLKVRDIILGRTNSDPLLTNEALVTLTQQLIEYFDALAKEILSSSKPAENATLALNKINNRFNLEIGEFRSLIELKEERSSSLKL